MRPGTPKLPRIDRRSRAARLLKDEAEALLDGLGREPSAADIILVEEIARLRLRSAALAASPNSSAREAVSIASLILEALRRLDIKPPAPPPPPTIADYLASLQNAREGDAD